jgi:hypothetical protein
MTSEHDQIPPGDSAEQRTAEDIIRDLAAEVLAVPLEKRRIDLDDGAWAEVDGASEDRSVLCEIWARQGKPKAAQKHKVMKDAFKLTYLRSFLSHSGATARLVLVFADEDAAAAFQGRSWMASALTDAGIELMVVSPDEETRTSILEAQLRQYR